MERDDLALIHFTINKMKLRYMEDEIIDEAYIGYVKALNSYSEEKGAFSTYACTCIRNEIATYFFRMNYPKRRANINCASLDTEIGENGTPLIEFVQDNFNLEEEMEKKVLVEQILDIAQKDLSEREYKVFISYYLKGYTNKKIGEMMNVTASMITHIRNVAIKKIRKKIGGNL